MDLHGKTWFIKHDGRITGPFGAETVYSMLDRGRLTRESLLSSDRAQWMEAGSFESLFPDDDVPMEDALPPEEVLTDTTQYFYNENGQRQGPVTFSRLNEMAIQGKLLGADLIWFEGSPGWVPASSIAGLQFVSVDKTASAWIKKNKALACAGFAMLLMLVVLPGWYVISTDRARVKSLEERKATLLAQEEAEKNRQHELEIENQKLEVEIRKLEVFAAQDREARRKQQEYIEQQKKNREAIAESERQEQMRHNERVEMDRENARTVADSNKGVEDELRRIRRGER